jgi:TetR/AcrR family transcriptional repressor of nem operon
MKNSSIDTKQHILDCGYTLIAQQGFSHVGLSQILAAADVPKGSFYHYFKSKEHFDNYLTQLTELLSHQQTNAYARLMHYWKLWLDTQSDTYCTDKRCLVVKLSAEVSDLSELMRKAFLIGTKAVIQKIAQCIEEGKTDGSIRVMDAELTAETLYQLWLGASLLAKLQQDASSLELAYRTTQEMLHNRTH